MRLMTLVLLGSLSHLATPAAAQTPREITIATGGIELAATLTVPAGDGPHPAILLLSGSGPSTRQALRKFSEPLNAGGFATFVFDKRGVGGSTGSWMSASFEDNVTDAVAALTRLRHEAGVDPRRLGVWGVSQAGWFIPAITARVPDLAFAIVLTGGGATPREVEMFMHEASLERAGANPRERVRARELLNAYFAWLGSGVGRQEVVDLMAGARADAWYKAIAIDGVMPSEANRPNWEWVALYDPLPLIEKMTLPTLVVLGGEDRMGSPIVAAERWRAGLEKAGNARASVVLIPGMGHAATSGATHAQGGAVMPEYTRTVAAFLSPFSSRTPK